MDIISANDARNLPIKLRQHLTSINHLIIHRASGDDQNECFYTATWYWSSEIVDRNMIKAIEMILMNNGYVVHRTDDLIDPTVKWANGKLEISWED